MNTEAYKRTMDRLIDEVWNGQNLDILAEVFTENATMHHGGPDDRGGHDMTGIAEFREGYMRPDADGVPRHPAPGRRSNNRRRQSGDAILRKWHARG